jgi:hypothetical protein
MIKTYCLKLLHNRCWLLFLFIFLFAGRNASAQTYMFGQLTGTPVNTTGWNLSGAAAPGNVTGTGNSEIILTPASATQSGAVFYNQAVNLTQCTKWTVEFDFRMFGGIWPMDLPSAFLMCLRQGL